MYKISSWEPLNIPSNYTLFESPHTPPPPDYFCDSPSLPSHNWLDITPHANEESNTSVFACDPFYSISRKITERALSQTLSHIKANNFVKKTSIGTHLSEKVDKSYATIASLPSPHSPTLPFQEELATKPKQTTSFFLLEETDNEIYYSLKPELETGNGISSIKLLRDGNLLGITIFSSDHESLREFLTNRHIRITKSFNDSFTTCTLANMLKLLCYFKNKCESPESMQVFWDQVCSYLR